MKTFKYPVTFSLIALMIVIILQNTEHVETDILFLTVTMSRAALLAFAGLLGFGLGVLTTLLMSRKFSRKD